MLISRIALIYLDKCSIANIRNNEEQDGDLFERGEEYTLRELQKVVNVL